VLEKNKELHEHGSNAFQNWSYHVKGVEQRVNDLRGRLQFHTTKILLVIDRLSLDLLTDTDSVVHDILGNTEETLNVARDIQAELSQFHASWAAHAAGHQLVTSSLRPDTHFASPVIRQTFERNWQSQLSERVNGEVPLAEYFDLLLAAFEQSREGTDQTPEKYLMLLKARWLLQTVQDSNSFQVARPGFYFKRAINQIAASINKRVRGTGLIAYDESTLMTLPDTAFRIWAQPEQSQTWDEDPTAARANEQEVVRLPLLAENWKTKENVIVFRRSDHDFRIVREIVSGNRTILKETHLNTSQHALIPRYALPSLKRELLEIATFHNNEETLYSFPWFESLFAFQNALTGYDVAADQGKIRFEFKQKWMDCTGRAQILQDPIGSQRFPLSSVAAASLKSNQSPPELTRRLTRQSSIVESLAPNTVSFVDGGLESEELKLPAIWIFTKLSDSQSRKRFAIVYFVLDPTITLIPERCDCHRQGNACKVLVLERRNAKRFPVRVLFSELDRRGEPNPNAFDLLPFRLPRHPKFSQLVSKETDTVVMKFDSLDDKKNFEKKLKERFRVRTAQSLALERTVRRLRHYEDRPNKAYNPELARVPSGTDEAIQGSLGSRMSSLSLRVPMPETGSIFEQSWEKAWQSRQ
jgi:hypothetical protein